MNIFGFDQLKCNIILNINYVYWAAYLWCWVTESGTAVLIKYGTDNIIHKKQTNESELLHIRSAQITSRWMVWDQFYANPPDIIYLRPPLPAMWREEYPPNKDIIGTCLHDGSELCLGSPYILTQNCIDVQKVMGNTLLWWVCGIAKEGQTAFVCCYKYLDDVTREKIWGSPLITL